MFEFILFIAVIALFINVSGLKQRISQLEKNSKNTAVKDTSSVDGLHQEVPANVHIEVVPSAPSAPSAPLAPSANPSEDSEIVFFRWLTHNWLSKLGVLLILIGFGWFISYAFVHDWIGPVGRVALGLIVGALLVGVGAVRVTKNITQAYTLIILGSALMMISVFAARVVYDFFTPISALILIFIIAVAVTSISVFFNQEKLATFGVLIGLCAPLFVRVSEMLIPELFIYLAVVSAASVWVAFIKGWGSVSVAALLGALLYATPIMFLGDGNGISDVDKTIVVVVTYLLALGYFTVNILQLVTLKDDVKQDTAAIAILNTILITGITLTLVSEQFQSILLVAWMIIFTSGSLLISVHVQRQTFFYIYASAAILFLGIATALELSGPVLIIAFMIEAVIITLVTFLITKHLESTARMALLLGVPSFMALPSLFSEKWRTDILHSDAAILALLSVLILTIGTFLMQLYKKGIHDEIVRTIYITLLLAGACFSFILLWLATHATLLSATATIISLSIYTIIGISFYLWGSFSHNVTTRYFGAAVLLFVVGRLLLIEVWNMELAPRIVMFVLIGILLVSTAFIGKTKKIEKPSV